MGSIARRCGAFVIGLALLLGMGAQPTMAADKLPLSGTTDVSAVGTTLVIDLAYRANAPITRFTVSLAGPSQAGLCSRQPTHRPR